MAALMVFSISACGNKNGTSGNSEAENQTTNQGEAVTDLAKVDSKAWQYNSDDDVYYQIGIFYCEKPADTNYETLANMYKQRNKHKIRRL